MRLTRSYYEHGESGPIFHVEVDIDIEAIAAVLARQVIENESRKGQLLDGKCKAKLITKFRRK